MKLLIGIYFSLIASFVFAESTPCNLKIDDSFKGEERLKILEVLNYISSIKGSGASRLHHKVFNGDVDGQTYCEFLKKNITGLLFSKEPIQDMIAMNMMGYVVLTGNILKTSQNLDIATILIHEAFHSKKPEHTICPDSFEITRLVGKPACDKGINSAYSVQYIFASNISQFCKNCSDIEMAIALETGKEGFERLIDKRTKRRLLKDVTLNH